MNGLLRLALLSFLAAAMGCSGGPPATSSFDRKLGLNCVYETVKKRAMAALPVARGGRVICGDAFGQVRCQDLHTGELIWEKKVASELAYHRPLILDDRVLMLGIRPKKLLALSLKTGAPLWERSGDAVDSTFLSSRIVGRRAYVEVGDEVLAIDGEEGDILWNRRGRLVEADEAWVLLEEEKGWLAVDAKSGTKRWERKKAWTAELR